MFPKVKLQWYLLIRVVIVSLLLGGTAYYYTRNVQFPLETPSFWYLIYLITFSYITSLMAAPFIVKNKFLHIVTYAELFFDLFFASALVLNTGCSESVFSFLYLLIILTAALILGKQGAIYSGSISILGYITTLLLQYFSYPVFPFTQLTFENLSVAKFTYSATMNSIAFSVVVMLSIVLSEQLRKTGVELSVQSAEVKRLSFLYENIVNSIPSGIVIVEAWGKITFLNESGFRITEMNPKDIIDVPFNDVFKNAPTPDELLKRSFPSDNIEFTTPGNTFRILRIMASPLSSPTGTSQQVIIVINDVTKITELETQLAHSERLAELGQVAAGLAHEIRNPLAAISGAIQLLDRQLDSPKAKNLTSMASDEIDRLDKLIRSLFDYTKPPQLNLEPISLTEIARYSLDEFKLGLEKDKVTVPEDIPDEPVIIIADKEMLKQIILNLLLNAYESLTDEEGLISIKISNTGDFSVLQISDTGCGIEPENQNSIFLPFFSTKAEGTGLGLAISHRLVEEMGGRITFESEPGKGSDFFIQFPVFEGGRQF